MTARFLESTKYARSQITDRAYKEITEALQWIQRDYGNKPHHPVCRPARLHTDLCLGTCGAGRSSHPVLSSFTCKRRARSNGRVTSVTASDIRTFGGCDRGQCLVSDWKALQRESAAIHL